MTFEQYLINKKITDLSPHIKALMLKAWEAATEVEAAKYKPISVEERAALQSQDREDGFSDGVLLALQMMAAAGDAGSHLYCELIETAGLNSIVRRALQEGMWELAGLNDPMSDRMREAINHARRVEGEL